MLLRQYPLLAFDDGAAPACRVRGPGPLSSKLPQTVVGMQPKRIAHFNSNNVKSHVATVCGVSECMLPRSLNAPLTLVRISPVELAEGKWAAGFVSGWNSSRDGRGTDCEERLGGVLRQTAARLLYSFTAPNG